jgi:hypothetical protein
MRLFAWLAALAFVLGGAITGYFAYNIAWQQAEEAVSAERATARLAGAGTAPPGGATPEPAPSPAGTMAETAAPALDDPAGDTVERVAQQQGGIDSRLAAAEQRLARLDLQSEAAAGNAARAEGLLIAFAARRALERGADLGYLADQLQLRFGDALPNAVAKVIAVSRDPVTVDRLVARLDGLAPQLARVQTRPSLDQLWSELGSLFVIRRETTPSPLPVARVERARLFLQSGRIEAAIAEVERLPGAGAADDWIEDARRYAQAQQALDLIETSAVLEPRRLRDGEGRRIDQPSPAAAPGEG